MKRPRAASSRERAAAARKRGALAEQVVADYLAAKGFAILGLNVRIGRLELDIIARRGALIAVVEVRNRGASSWQSALGSIDRVKTRRTREAGERLWRERFEADATAERMRFDVATVSFDPNGETVVEYFEGVL